MNNLLTIFALSTLLFSCAEAPSSKVTSYLLNTPEFNKSVVQSLQKITMAEHENRLILDDIVLPEYLKQPSLVMLVSGNQLHYAHYHVWGESLEQGIKKTLTLFLNHLFGQQQLNQQQVGKLLVLEKNDVNKTLHLSLEIDHFYPTDQGDVILTGRYWFNGSSSKVNNLSYKKNTVEFNFKQSIIANGYSQTVKQMHVLLGKLANNINQQTLVYMTTLPIGKRLANKNIN